MVRSYRCGKKVMSSRGISNEETPHSLTLKSIEDMATNVLENNKIVEMF
jgi:hypothetical protein